MEILRVLSSPDIDVRRKSLDIALQMVSSKNVEEIVLLLKKELAKTVDEQQYEKVNGQTTLCDNVGNTNVLTTELRIPPTPHSVHPPLRYQILRSCG